MAEPAWARSWFRIPTITSKCQTFFGCNAKDKAVKNIVGPYVLLVGVWLFLLYHCGSVLYFAHSTALQSLNGWTLANSYGHPLINIHEALVPGIGKGDTSFSWLDPKPLKKIPTTNVFGDEPLQDPSSFASSEPSSSHSQLPRGCGSIVETPSQLTFEDHFRVSIGHASLHHESFLVAKHFNRLRTRSY